MEKVARAKRLQRQADKLRMDMEATDENTWRNFTVSHGRWLVKWPLAGV